jgi:chromosome transmission fidelity protein 1
MIHELGRALLQLCEIVPDGVVVFFGSYAYLDSVCSLWKKASSDGNGGKSVWEEMQQRKAIFVEPSSNAAGSSNTANPASKQPMTSFSSAPTTTSRHTTSTSSAKPPSSDTILQAYTSHILSPSRNDNGAVLLAVIGGSLSEGINFSDRLGRCVVVVGLPFPNASGGEWKARLEHVGMKAVETTRRELAIEVERKAGIGGIELGDEGAAQSATAVSAVQDLSAMQAKEIAEKAKREFYTNTCMRSVNQSVGRAIRHQNDWASILLFDGRWEKRKELREKLPGWIQRSLVVAEGGARGDLGSPGKWIMTRRRLQQFFEAKSRG